MSNIALMNGMRLETRTRTSDGVLMHQPYYRPTDAVEAANAFAVALKIDGTGAVDMNLDGSSTVRNFWHTGLAATVTTIKTLGMVLSDTAILAAGFGGIAALTNGLAVDLVAVDLTTVLYDLTAGLGVKSHGDLIALGASVQFLESGAGDDLVAIKWTFAAPIELLAGQRFRVRVRDDLTGLTGAYAVLTGDTRTA